MKIRQWYVTEALVSARRLREVIDELTAQEIIAALELESGSSRRGSLIELLIQKATRLNELEFSSQLKRKYHVPHTIQNHVAS